MTGDEAFDHRDELLAPDDHPDPAPLDVHVEIQRLRGMFVPAAGDE